ncbi:MAG: tetratricopeptide repeat protein [Microcoleus sp. SU_5_3]|nr:tetratricopeptide repeat protein [Microcoleus sp. SU_5_3]
MARKRHLFFFRIQSFLRIIKSWHKLKFFIELKNENKRKNIICYLFVAVFLIIGILPVTTRVNAGDLVVQNLQNPSKTVQDSKEKDETRQFSIQNLEQAVKAFRASKDNLKLSMTLSNLSLAYQQQGQWQKADEAITESQEVLKLISSTSQDKRKLLAHALEVEGKLKLSIGKTEEALSLWQKAYTKFDEVGDESGKIRTNIHQSLALQELGFYLEAFKILEASIKSKQIQSEPLKATAYRVLGNVLRVVGYTEDDRKELKNYLPFLKQEINEQSLDDIKISKQKSLNDSQLELSQRLLQESLNISKKEKSEALLSLGNIIQEAYYRSKNAYDRLNTQWNDPRVQLGFKDDAIFYYEQAQEEAIKVNLPIISIQAELNKLSFFNRYKSKTNRK